METKKSEVEIIEQCSFCGHYMDEKELITNAVVLDDIRSKIENTLAIVSRETCYRCMCVIYPDFCKE